MSNLSNNSTSLEQTLSAINRKYGDGAVIRLGESRLMDLEIVPTGSLALDIALGIGGLPCGRVIEIFGPESSGKTTICQHVLAEAQRNEGLCAFIDMEHALDPDYAARCGVDLANLYVAQPESGEQALEISETLIRSGSIAVLVIDSVAALVPRADIEGEMGDVHLGLQARLMSQALRKLSGIIKQTNSVVIFTNQLRSRIGVMYGNPETTSGGNALKFYASIRLDVRRLQRIKSSNQEVGCRIRVRVVKNKVAPPFTEAEFDILYSAGISKGADILDLGVKGGLIEKRGNSFRFCDTLLGQGRDYAIGLIEKEEEIYRQLEYLIKRQHSLPAEIPDVNVAPQ